MTRFAIAAISTAVGFAGAANAAGVERGLTPFDVMFEPGNYVQFTFGGAQPDVSGTEPDVPFGGDDSGDMSVGYGNVGIAYKGDLTEALSLGLFYGEPFGANIAYPSGTGYYAAAATAELDTHALTGVLKYRFANNISIYGGVRFQTLEANANLPYVGLGYTADGERGDAWGYLVGAAYERPDIALRVGLTYLSEISHDIDVDEEYIGFVAPGVIAAGRLASTTEIVTPRQVVLDFQTGVAEDTLVFGDIRWVEWTAFEIAPEAYSEILLSPLDFQNFDPLVSFEDDRWTFSLGVGRQLTENWSVAGTVGYEPSTGSVTGNLGPTDGFTSVGLGVSYTQDRVRVTTGLQYLWLGDAETPQGSDFDGNTAIAGAIQLGIHF